jgi:AAA domain, putative AbiEii toxin, Type IV TA system/AAA domain
MTKIKTPAYSLSGIRIEKFKGIKQLKISELPADAPWIFLTGENGFGKTSVLQALAIGLYGFESHTFEFARIDQPVFLRVNIFNRQTGQFETFQPKIEKRGFKNLCCYGSSRLDMHAESSTSSDGSDSPTISLFETRTLLNNIEHQISRWYFKRDDEEFSNKYRFVTKILKDLLHLKKIEIIKKTDEVLYYEKDPEGLAYGALPSKSLAAGYRSIIAILGDMILRLFDTQPGIYDPSQLKGIVIIDELDLHLHPKWQKKLPSLFSKIFPEIQFIASTHSPIPLLGAPKGSVFLKVNRTVEEGITVERLEHLENQVTDMLPNTILTSPIFGLQEIFPSQHHHQSRIRTEDTYDEMQFNDKVEERLKSFLDSEKEKELEATFKPKPAK